MYTVAVSYLEWIRWIATGWFRCADRVVWVKGVEDQQGMDALMDRTPDLQVSDDQGYVIARLNPDALISGRVGERERSVSHLWLSVASVSSFHPLSSRGARLLEADAERATVFLGEPIFENLWVDWRDRRLEDESHWRGLSLCAALGLESPDLLHIPNQVTDILTGRKLVPNAADIRERAIEGTRALGWVSAMSVALLDPAIRAAFKERPEDLEVRTMMKRLREDFDLSRPLLDNESVKSISRDIDRVLRDLGAGVLPIALVAIVSHYRSLALGAREISLGALIEDLVALAIDNLSTASLAAYFIGRSMENVAVTTLLYQSSQDRYPSIVPVAAERNLNVVAQANDRSASIEKTTQGVSEAELAVSSSLGGRIVNEYVDGPNSEAGKLLDKKSAENQTDISGDSTICSKLPEEANSAISGLNADTATKEELPKENVSLADSLQEHPLQTPDQELNDDPGNPNDLGVEQPEGANQQTVEGVELVSGKPKERNRKKRVK